MKKNEKEEIGKMKVELICKISKIYLEQLDCFVFSGKEFSAVSLHDLKGDKLTLKMSDL